MPQHIASEDEQWVTTAKKRAKMSQLAGNNLGKNGIRHFVGAMNNGYFQVCNDVNAYSTLSFNLNQDLPCKGEPIDISLRCFQMAQEHGLIRLADNRQSFRFLTDEAACYLGGLWLEEYLWLSLKNCSELDVSASVKGYWMTLNKNTAIQDISNTTHNEMDTVVIKNNIAHLIECKTGGYSRKNRSKETLEEIATLTSHMGGRLAKGYLVTLHDLTLAEKARAEQLNVQVFAAEKINDLIKLLRS